MVYLANIRSESLLLLLQREESLFLHYNTNHFTDFVLRMIVLRLLVQTSSTKGLVGCRNTWCRADISVKNVTISCEATTFTYQAHRNFQRISQEKVQLCVVSLHNTCVYDMIITG